MIRALLVDDYVSLHRQFKSLLERRSGIEVVAVVADGPTAIRRVWELDPDVVVMDLMLEAEMSGIEATRQICAENPARRVVAFTASRNVRVVRELLRAGGCGYVRKACPGDDIIAAIHAAARGERYLAPDLRAAVEREEAEGPDWADLTAMDRTILRLLAAGREAKVIAFELELGADTVRYHRNQIKRKLRLDSDADLIKYAIQIGLTSLAF
ncbi:MAG TPA: response regulator transcription factor [Polyangia bacterium]|jgi:DNA-binding NarL/FixJ family response regulator